MSDHDPNLGVIFFSTDGWKVCRTGNDAECEVFQNESYLCTVPDEAVAFRIISAIRFTQNMKNAEARDNQMREEGAKADRKKTIRELLIYFKFSCPGGEITPICDMCSANPYCIELRSPEQKKSEKQGEGR